ncbi:unnamed protein product [Effrenium voratum]|nr:unnamed protein product [Effrenium voratum]
MENAPIEMAGNAGDVDLFRGDLRRFLSGTALFSLQFSVQAGGIEVLSRVDHGQNEEAPNSMSSLLAAERISEVAFTLALFLSATLGTAAYLRFGDKVAGNVLLDFNPSYAPLLVSWISYGFVVVCSFAFIMVPCRLAALDVLALRRRDNPSIESVPKERFMSLTAALLGVCAVVAWTVTDLSHVLKFVGVWATMALAFVLPCSFLIELRRRQEGVSVFSSANLVDLVLIAFGLCVACAALLDLFAPSTPTPHRVFVPNMAEVGGTFPTSQVVLDPDA